MSAVYPKFETGPVTFAAEAEVTGGQVVVAGIEPRTVKPADADATNIVGVAIQDAKPEGPTKHTAVACSPAQIAVKVVGSVAVGDLVKTAADGAVTKADPAADAGKILGRVIETLAEEHASIRLYV
ncbi:DUF2190 family protein [Corynebacterium aurimucosum]|uniref:DUF2190 family protein n=1 Tax=Corynebacterium aurimucosum TaxID=169292 RepID=UPI00187ABD4E|nr:DUF2190 family protein [Corynebacterium aurimucosum]MBE7338118.1 DUF2190 family protein [Corynebacterium aurimucosum]